MTVLRLVLVVLTHVFVVNPLAAEPLRLLAWNVESGDPTAQDPTRGNNPETIARELREMSGYDIVGLSEVKPTSVQLYVDALSAGGDTFLSIHSAAGWNDRLVLVFNTKRLQLLGGYEMHRFGDWQLNEYGDDGNLRYRSPLVGHFRDRATGTEFLVTVNHLARGNEGIRRRQAAGLRKWAEAQSLPVFAIGDFNFDYNFQRRQGNKAFQMFMQDGVWKWVEPESLVDTNWADDDPRLPLKQRTDHYPGSCLDFIFVAGAAKNWPAGARVIVRPNDFPDTGETSDHRPVAAVFKLPK